jgi:hypothetical protein
MKLVGIQDGELRIAKHDSISFVCLEGADVVFRYVDLELGQNCVVNFDVNRRFAVAATYARS